LLAKAKFVWAHGNKQALRFANLGAQNLMNQEQLNSLNPLRDELREIIKRIS